MAISTTPFRRISGAVTSADQPKGIRLSNDLTTKLLPLARLLTRDAAWKTMRQGITDGQAPETKVTP